MVGAEYRIAARREGGEVWHAVERLDGTTWTELCRCRDRQKAHGVLRCVHQADKVDLLGEALGRLRRLAAARLHNRGVT